LDRKAVPFQSIQERKKRKTKGEKACVSFFCIIFAPEGQCEAFCMGQSADGWPGEELI